jgi:CheY-like chemotaxis protein
MPTLLYIDDQTCGSRMLVQKLRNAGYEVEIAPDADEAVGLFRLYAVDAVLMDCHCEGKSRQAIAPALRRISPNTPIVMLSSFCRVPCKGFQYADACIQKGDFSLLLGALRSALCARNYGLFQAVAA